MVPTIPPPTSECSKGIEVRVMRMAPRNLSQLSDSAKSAVAKAIREIGWDDESIAAGAFIISHTELVAKARDGKLDQIEAQDQIAFYSLLTFLGLSKDELADMDGGSNQQIRATG